MKYLNITDYCCIAHLVAKYQLYLWTSFGNICMDSVVFVNFYGYFNLLAVQVYMWSVKSHQDNIIWWMPICNMISLFIKWQYFCYRLGHIYDLRDTDFRWKNKCYCFSWSFAKQPRTSLLWNGNNFVLFFFCVPFILLRDLEIGQSSSICATK